MGDRAFAGADRTRARSRGGRGTAIVTFFIFTENLLMPCPYSCCCPSRYLRSHVHWTYAIACRGTASITPKYLPQYISCRAPAGYKRSHHIWTDILLAIAFDRGTEYWAITWGPGHGDSYIFHLHRKFVDAVPLQLLLSEQIFAIACSPDICDRM